MLLDASVVNSSVPTELSRLIVMEPKLSALPRSAPFGVTGASVLWVILPEKAAPSWMMAPEGSTRSVPPRCPLKSSWTSPAFAVPVGSRSEAARALVAAVALARVYEMVILFGPRVS